MNRFDRPETEAEWLRRQEAEEHQMETGEDRAWRRRRNIARAHNPDETPIPARAEERWERAYSEEDAA